MEKSKSPMMKQWRYLKSKHPDAVLLFRCGDFYEAYGTDAKTCALDLGVTLTWRTPSKRHAPGDYDDAMAGFPHHALDTYLPRLIRCGHRVAICNQLETPKTKSTNNPQKMKLNLSNNKNDESKNVQNAQVNNNANDAVVHQVDVIGMMTALKRDGHVKLSDHATPVVLDATPVEDAVYEEIKDEPKPGKPVTLKKKVTIKEKKPKTAPKKTASKAEKHEAPGLPKVGFTTYKTKKGADAPMIVGFTGEDDPRWRPVYDSRPKYVSASYRTRPDGTKDCYMMFGTRYMDAAKRLTCAYNQADKTEWHKAEEACKAVYEQAVADGKARWEEKKQHWAEKKAAKAKEAKPAGYSASEVAAMLKDVMSGKALPADVAKLMKAA